MTPRPELADVRGEKIERPTPTRGPGGGIARRAEVLLMMKPHVREVKAFCCWE
jgi:hypothetical protein